MNKTTNKDIVKLLKSISAAYSVKGAPIFKVIAYDRAADNIEKLTTEVKDLWEEGKLKTIPGLGKSMQTYLDQLFKTGRVEHFESIKKDLPPLMFEMLDLTGMGPKTAYKLAKELNLKSIDDLKSAAKSGKIRGLDGFGQKSEEEILTSIGEHENKSSRVPLPFAFSQAQKVIFYLKKISEVKDAQPLGSLRRMVATIGDVDIAVASDNPDAVINHFKNYPEITRLLGAGKSAASAILANGIQVDLKVQPPEAFGALLQHFTGSKNHNIHLREIALKKNLSLSEQGIKKNGKKLKFKTEKEFYNFLGLAYIEPEIREDTGEIEAAIAKNLPDLININDIKGDIHLHSNYPIEPSHDLGNQSFEEITKKAIELNYDYIGLSDHSPGFSTHTKEQIIYLIKQRTKKIEQLKYANKNIGILNLLEIDILKDGTLSVPDEGLKLLDFAIAGIHSSHQQDKNEITKRLLVAINSPFVKVISHPTGRLLLQRNSYEADWTFVFKECARTNTFLEINSWPSRLDLPDDLIRQAIKAGVKLVINSDAHDISHMDNIKFGVSTARRGWATKKDIINTYSWLEFKRATGLS